MSDLVGNPEDQFSHNKAQIILFVNLNPEDRFSLNKDRALMIMQNRALEQWEYPRNEAAFKRDQMKFVFFVS